MKEPPPVVQTIQEFHAILADMVQNLSDGQTVQQSDFATQFGAATADDLKSVGAQSITRQGDSFVIEYHTDHKRVLSGLSVKLGKKVHFAASLQDGALQLHTIKGIQVSRTGLLHNDLHAMHLAHDEQGNTVLTAEVRPLGIPTKAKITFDPSGKQV
jgi:hypothetical protein